MKYSKIFMVALITLTLAACGGGGGTSATAPPALLISTAEITAYAPGTLTTVNVVGTQQAGNAILPVTGTYSRYDGTSEYVPSFGQMGILITEDLTLNGITVLIQETAFADTGNLLGMILSSAVCNTITHTTIPGHVVNGQQGTLATLNCSDGSSIKNTWTVTKVTQEKYNFISTFSRMLSGTEIVQTTITYQLNSFGNIQKIYLNQQDNINGVITTLETI